jgi:hypothetical protein
VTKELAVASGQRTVSRFHFHQGFFTKSNMTAIPTLLTHLAWPPVTFLFSLLKIKLKGCHVIRTEVIKAELQAVMNTLAEYDIQDAFKNGRSAWNGAYMQKGTILRVMVASRPKVSF